MFFNGVHIGNNWARTTDIWGERGEMVRRYSLAALNPKAIAFAIGAPTPLFAKRLEGLVEGGYGLTGDGPA